jgi:hypothetical protein
MTSHNSLSPGAQSDSRHITATSGCDPSAIRGQVEQGGPGPKPAVRIEEVSPYRVNRMISRRPISDNIICDLDLN